MAVQLTDTELFDDDLVKQEIAKAVTRVVKRVMERRSQVIKNNNEYIHEDDMEMRCGHLGRSWSSEWKRCIECI